MNTMIISPHHFDDVEPMQEIEVISSDGCDNITTTSSSSSSSSSPIISSVVTFPPKPDSTVAEDTERNRQKADDAMQVLLAMVEKEQTIPPIDYDSLAQHDGCMADGCIELHPHHGPTLDNAVKNIDRQKMVEWYYEMADFLKIDRSTASRAMILLDRFMATSYRAPAAAEARKNRDQYQLFALTALFLSIKLFERLNIQAEHVSYLSRGRYQPQEIVKMETMMLAALEWKVCEATKVDYVDNIMNYIVPRMENSSSYAMSNSSKLLDNIKELALLQIQLSDFEATFASRKQSVVAFAAICNAFENKKTAMSQPDRNTFHDCIKSLMRIMSLTDRSGREELGSTIQDLRYTVDPQGASPLPHNSSLTATIHRGEGGDDARSYSTQDVEDLAGSPIDCALESMESFSMSSFLCCGASTQPDNPPAELTVVHNSSNSCCYDFDDDDQYNRCNAMDNFNNLINCGSFDSSTSFESVDLTNNTTGMFKPIQKKDQTSSRSPTSISMMLCGL